MVLQAGDRLPRQRTLVPRLYRQEENPSLELGQKKADNLSRKSGLKKAVNPYRE